MDSSSRIKAASAANQLLRQLGINSLPVDVLDIAKAIDVKVIEKPDAGPGVSGLLLKHGNAFIIAYSTHIKSKGFQRFSIGHEFGHLHIPGHADTLLPIGSEFHESRAGYRSLDHFEREADDFAANLLMPTRFFSTEMRRAGEGFDAILKLAEICQTSLLATAIRYVNLTHDAIAIVVSEGSTLCYAFLSDAMKEFRDIQWPRRNTTLGRVPTTIFNQDIRNVSNRERESHETPMTDWFGGYHEAMLIEEIIGLGRYGRTLTVLTSDRMPEEDTEDEELVDSWQPQFKK